MEHKDPKPPKLTIYQKVNQKINESYISAQELFPESWWRLLESKEQGIGQIDDIPLSSDLLLLIFFKPEIAIQFPRALLKSHQSLSKAIASGHKIPIQESFFAIEYRSHELKASAIQEKPAGFDVQVPEGITRDEFPGQQTVAVVHTHPPTSHPTREVLKPSVVVEDENLGYKGGDLHAFLLLRKYRREGIQEGKKPSFLEQTISVIMQEDWDRGKVKLMCITEGSGTMLLEDKDYYDMLQNNSLDVEQSQSEREVVENLRNLGFLASYTEVPSEEFYNYPFLTFEDIQNIVSSMHTFNESLGITYLDQLIQEIPQK